MLPPLPPGFTARTASLDDIQVAAAAGQEYALAVTGFSDIDAESLRNLWQTPNFDPSEDVYLVFGPDGQLAGYYEIWANMRPPVHPFIFGMVAIDCQGLGIGTHMLAWAERRVWRLVDLIPVEARLAPVSGFSIQDTAARKFLENNGYAYLRSSYIMRIDWSGPEPAAPPPPAVFPPHLHLRAFQPEHAEAIFRANDEAFSDHFGHVDQPFEVDFARFKQFHLKDPLFDPGLWFIAWDGDEVAGICLCRAKAWDDPECGYVNSLGVRRRWRKQGLGLALLQRAFCEFYSRGYRKVSLGVDAYNLTGALRLYEKAGMRVVRQYDQYEKELRPGVELRVQ